MLTKSQIDAATSSKRMDWATPWKLFRQLDHEFHFTVDVCATAENAKCELFFTPEDDGLRCNWAGHTCWMNPPYGSAIVKWVAKAARERLWGATTVGLIPARTDARWFHDWVLGQAEIRFLQGRVKFCGAKYGALFPSAIAIWRPK